MKTEIQMYTVEEVVKSIAKTGSFNFGDYDYVVTINPDAHERSAHLDFNNAKIVVAGYMYHPEPSATDWMPFYMDQCAALTAEAKKFLKLNLTEAAWASLNFTKIRKNR